MGGEENTYRLSLPNLRVTRDPTTDIQIPPPIDISGTPRAKLQAGPPDSSIIAGRYQIEEKIGEGGMGKVYRVVHLRLNKPFALKLMHAEISQSVTLRKQFYKEARVASSLAHPNIVSVVDFGEDPEWGAFMVMELLRGELLGSRLKRHGRLSVKVALDVTLQIADAVHYIHEQNVVHADIKPDNVVCSLLQSRERRRWTIKLLDFGLAQLRDANPGRSATVAGTPEYLAPERIEGHSPTPAMDIYSLGVVLYELLAGRPPFQGELFDVIDGHLHFQPSAPSVYREEPIDERLEAMILRALAKRPEERQQTMEAFLYELRTCMDMLGYGRRRSTRSDRSVADAEARRKLEAKARGFDAAPVPLATVGEDGAVVTANAAFATFLTGESGAVVDGAELVDTAFLKIHPGLMADLRRVRMSGESYQVKLHLADTSGRPVLLLLSLVPIEDGDGDVLIALHTLA